MLKIHDSRGFKLEKKRIGKEGGKGKESTFLG